MPRNIFALAAIVSFFIAFCVAMGWMTFVHEGAVIPFGLLCTAIALFWPATWTWGPRA